MRRLGVLVVIAAMVLTTGSLAGAQQPDINIPLDTVVRGVPEDGVVELTSVPVAPELQGATCTGIAIGRNNAGSVHPGNDLIVSTGDTTAVVADVEREPGVVTTISGELVLGTDITVSLRMGSSGTFSGGIDVSLDCTPPPPDTTTTTTAPPPPTTEPPATTTTPPPPSTVPQPEPTTTTVPPPPSTVPQPEPTTTVPPQATTIAPPDTTGQEIPATGPRAANMSIVAAGAALVGVGAVAVAWERRRRHGS